MTEWLERNGFIPIPERSLTDDEIQVLKSIMGEPLEGGRVRRLIDADALMQTLGITDTDCGKCDLHGAMGCSKCGDFVDACIAIEHAPTIEVRKNGKWLHDKDDTLLSGYCSCCGWESIIMETDVADMPFCPNCGADMRGEHDE